MSEEERAKERIMESYPVTANKQIRWKWNRESEGNQVGERKRNINTKQTDSTFSLRPVCLSIYIMSLQSSRQSFSPHDKNPFQGHTNSKTDNPTSHIKP